MKYIKILLELPNVYIEKEFSTVKELNDFILNLYVNKKLTRMQASELMGVTPTALSQMKHRLKEK